MISLGIRDLFQREQEAEKERERQRRDREAEYAQARQDYAGRAAYQAQYNAAQEAYARAFNAYGGNLPPNPFAQPAAPVIPAWAVALGVSPSDSLSHVESAYKKLVQSAHPDHGGSHDAMVKLNKAIADARHALRARN